MFLISKSGKRSGQYSYLETFSFVLIYLSIGYMINPEDPCMLRHELSYLTIVLAIITLFHGMRNGLVGIMIIGVVMTLFYPVMPYQEFLKELVLVLIFGEFHYYWTRNIAKDTIKIDFLQTKLDELSKAFYTLKISHDQLEKNYVVKSMSLRSSMRSIKDDFWDKGVEESYRSFLMLLEKSFNIEKVFLCSVSSGNKMNIIAKSGSDMHFNENDPMIQSALEKKMPIYLDAESKHEENSYLAVIPALSKDEVVGILIIERMFFISFDKDNLISISILLTYFFDEVRKSEVLKNMGDEFSRFQENFRFEMHRLFDLDEIYKINSTVLVFRSRDEMTAHRLLEKSRENLRSLDVISDYRLDDIHIIALLFPFANHASCSGFLNRILSLLQLEEDPKQLEYSIFDISQRHLIKAYVEPENG